jgi:hypothetical protein
MPVPIGALLPVDHRTMPDRTTRVAGRSFVTRCRGSGKANDLMPEIPLPLPAFDAQAVAAMAALAGISIPAERLPLVAERLREIHGLAAELAELDLDGIDPDNRFDPSWSEEVAE